MTESFRDRDRKKYHAVGGSFARSEERRGGNRPGAAPVRAPKKPKGPAPHPGMPCRVKNADGQYYDLMDVAGQELYLFVNDSMPEGRLFPSRNKASSAVSRTIKRMENDGYVWNKLDFVMENVT